MTRPVFWPIFLLSISFAGCSEQDAQERGDEIREVPLAEELGWTRAGTIQIPSVHVGDVYRLQYDVENIGNTVASEVWRVREAPGEFVDRTGARFKPPAVLEHWQPGVGQGTFLVLDPAGRIMATLIANGFGDEPAPSDFLPVAWERGKVQYGPNGLPENTGRIFLLLGLAGRTFSAQDLHEWQAYLTTFDLHGWTNDNGTRVGTVGYVHNGGSMGAYERPPVPLAAEYEFTGAPVPSSIVARKGLYGGELGQEGLMARLTGWEPGTGPAVQFVDGSSRFVLAEDRILPGPWLPAEGMPVELSYENMTGFLMQNATFREWTQAHPDFWMRHAFYDDFWVDSSNEKAKPKWTLWFESADYSSLRLRVSLNSQEPHVHPSVQGLLGNMSPSWMSVDRFQSGQIAQPMNLSLVPDIVKLDAALHVARSWAIEKTIVDQVSVRVGDGPSPWGYRFPPDWPRDVWFGGGTACLTFREPGADQRFGVTNVHVDLVTGWITYTDLDADASHCN